MSTARRDLGRKAAKGSAWVLSGFAAGQFLRLGSNLVLTRLVPLEAFGLMLMVNAVMRGVNMFSDVGIGPSIIQAKREDEKFLNTAWTIQLLRGAIITVLALAVAWPMALFFDQSVLVGLIAFTGCTGVLAGLRSSNFHSANRSLSIGRVTAIDFAGKVLGVVVTLAWAFVAPSVWALAAGGVVTALVISALSHVVLPGVRNRLAWDRESAQSVFSFGKWVFLSTILGFLAMESDRFVFGAIFDVETLGVYAIATLLATAPQQVFRRLALNVDFPVYSETFRRKGDLPRVFRDGRKRVLMLAGFVCSAMIAGGPVIIDILYPEQYEDAGWMLQLLALATWFNTLEVTIEAAMLARGESYKVAVASGAKLVAMAVLIPVGYWMFGIVGAVGGFAGSEAVRYAALGGMARSAKLRGVRQELGTTLVLGVASALGYVAVRSVEGVPFTLFVQTMVLLTVVALAWLPLMAPQLRRELGRFRRRR